MGPNAIFGYFFGSQGFASVSVSSLETVLINDHSIGFDFRSHTFGFGVVNNMLLFLALTLVILDVAVQGSASCV